MARPRRIDFAPVVAGPEDQTMPRPNASRWMTDELECFRRDVRQFVAEAFVPRQAAWRAGRGPDPGAWGAAGAAGLLAPDIPAAYGGAGGTFAHVAVVVEELTRGGVNFGAGVQAIVAQYVLAYGTEEQKCAWLPLFATGEIVAAIAMTEPGAGSDLQAIATRAVLDGGEYVIDGRKTLITNGARANFICLAARTGDQAGPGALSMIFVDARSLDGYRAGPSLEKIGQHDQDTADLTFDAVRVPATAVAGGRPGRGFLQMMEQLPYERLALAVGAIASAEAALELTIAHAKRRQVFGKPLIDLQGPRFSLAECATAVRVARVFVDDCLAQLLGRRLTPETAAMAKYWLTDCQARVLDACLQLHGGQGYLADSPIGRMWADARMGRIGGGTTEIMKEVIGWSL
jgi:acyl-CoA dehydrogenase